MLENILRFREPTTWVVLAVTTASMVLALVRAGVSLATGGTDAVAASQDVANSAMNLTLVVLVVALVCTCLFLKPSTPRAVAVTRVAAIVVTIGTLLTLVATLVGLSASAGALGMVLEALGGLVDVVLKGVAAIVLWLTVRAIGAGRLEPATQGASAEVEAAAPSEVAPRQAPSWRPSEASGSVWRTASEAAEGSPASAHGTPGAGTWQRVERPLPATGEQALPGEGTPHP